MIELLCFVMILAFIAIYALPFFLLGFAIHEKSVLDTVHEGNVVWVESVDLKEDGAEKGVVAFKGKDENGELRIIQVKMQLNRAKSFDKGDKVYYNDGVLIEDSGDN